MSGLLFSGLITTPPAQSNALCSATREDAVVAITHVIDGDTVVLASSEKLRLIGIDTPELAYRDRAAEAGAEDARDFLRQLLTKQGTYRLQLGAERRDHHGRLLAHLFLADGRNVQALLLGDGYARPLNIPPNIAFSACYQEHTAKAIASRRGIWARTEYQLIPSELLSPGLRGYRRISGTVTRLGHSKSALWLNLGAELAIRIQREDLQYFPEIALDTLNNRRILVRGELYYRNKQLRLRVRHQSDLELL